jgi:7-cyano-7-deazaguanine synthase
MAPADPNAAVVLLSGGLDSATCLAIARESGLACHCLTADYGQRHLHELRAAERVAEHLGAASHRLIRVGLGSFGGSALTEGGSVPKSDAPADLPALASERESSIPATYVPARNTVLLACALGLAEVLGAGRIVIGANAVDYSGYPDCRPEFIDAFQRLAEVGTRAGVEGHAPAIDAPLLTMTKSEIIARGLQLGVDYALTSSCYDPDPADGRACGSCDACRIRAAAFAQLRMADPAQDPPATRRPASPRD